MILTVTHSFSVPVYAKEEKKENIILSLSIPLKKKKVKQSTRFHLGRDYSKMYEKNERLGELERFG